MMRLMPIVRMKKKHFKSTTEVQPPPDSPAHQMPETQSFPLTRQMTCKYWTPGKKPTQLFCDHTPCSAVTMQSFYEETQPNFIVINQPIKTLLQSGPDRPQSL